MSQIILLCYFTHIFALLGDLTPSDEFYTEGHIVAKKGLKMKNKGIFI